MTESRSYSELRTLPSFEDRFNYLCLAGIVGDITFGSERHLNQRFYNSQEWKQARNQVIVRDNGCDLGIPGREINSTIYIHHINPITPDDLHVRGSALFDPENLISVTHRTHNAIHWGDVHQLERDPVERRPGDTKEW